MNSSRLPKCSPVVRPVDGSGYPRLCRNPVATQRKYDSGLRVLEAFPESACSGTHPVAHVATSSGVKQRSAGQRQSMPATGKQYVAWHSGGRNRGGAGAGRAAFPALLAAGGCSGAAERAQDLGVVVLGSDVVARAVALRVRRDWRGAGGDGPRCRIGWLLQRGVQTREITARRRTTGARPLVGHRILTRSGTGIDWVC